MAIFSGCSFLVTILLIGLSSVAYSSDAPTECKGTYFADPNDCNKFYVCVHDQPMQWTCPGELHWNDEFKTCDWEYSANCAASNNQTPNHPQNQPMSEEEHPGSNNEIAQHDEFPSRDSFDDTDAPDQPSPIEPDSIEPPSSVEDVAPVEPNHEPNQSNTKCGGQKKSVCYCKCTEKKIELFDFYLYYSL